MSGRGGTTSKQPIDDLRVLAERFDELQPHFGPDPADYLPLVIELLRRTGGTTVELGCGTGGFLAALRQHTATAVLGVEIDPVLSTLARRVHGVDVVSDDLRDLGWLTGHSPTVVLAARTLHYPSRAEVAALYRRLGERLPNGSALVNADRFGPASGPAEDAALAGWRDWWRDAADTPQLAEPIAARAAVRFGSGNAMTVHEHENALTTAGFVDIDVRSTGPSPTDAVIVATVRRGG